MVASTLGPHWAVDADEARRLNVAVNNVARHYMVFASEKSRDWGALMIVALQIAGPRAWVNLTTPVPARPDSRPAAAAAAPVRANGNGAAVPQTPGQLDPGSMVGSYATTAGL